MEEIKKSMLTGVFAGILAPAITMGIIYLVNFNAMNFSDYLNYLFKIQVLSKLISLCAVPNLAVFFIFIKLNWLNPAKGVILSTILFGFLIMVLKYAI